VVTRALLLETHPEMRRVDAIVLRVADDGVHVHNVDRALFSRGPAILAALSLQAQKAKDVKRRRK
jgi:hypothetical protein